MAISRLYDFAAGTLIRSAEVDTELNSIITEVNRIAAAGVLAHAAQHNAAGSDRVTLHAPNGQIVGGLNTGGVPAGVLVNAANHVVVGASSSASFVNTYLDAAVNLVLRTEGVDRAVIDSNGNFSVGGSPIVKGVEALRTIRGNVNANGTVANGAGFTVTKAGVGGYTINFSTAFSAPPAVTMSGPAGAIIGDGSAGFPTAISATVSTNSSTGTPSDQRFSFIATGPA